MGEPEGSALRGQSRSTPPFAGAVTRRYGDAGGHLGRDHRRCGRTCARGHRRLAAAGLHVAGCVSSDGRARADIGRLGVKVIGDESVLDEQLARRPVDVFVAVGDNRARRDSTALLLRRGARLVPAVSPHAVVSAHATIADGALIMPGVVVNALASIGAGVILNTGASIDHECVVGDFAHIAPGVAVAGNVTVGEGALVGIGAAVTPGCSIAAWSTVGAGATVIDDVVDATVVAGTPAREIARR